MAVRKEIIFPCVNLLIISVLQQDMLFVLLFLQVRPSRSLKLTRISIRLPAAQGQIMSKGNAMAPGRSRATIFRREKSEKESMFYQDATGQAA
jgi:hypothetical protein